MRDSTTIFDQESDAAADEAADLTTEFWGDSAAWVGTSRARRSDRTPAFQVQPADESTRSFRLDHTPASMRAIRDGLAAFRPKKVWRDTSSVERTREHGIVRPSGAAVAAAETDRAPSSPRRPSPDRLAHRDASIGDLAAGRYDGAPFPRSGHDHASAEVPVADDDLIELTPVHSTGVLRAVDPMVVRLVLVALAVVLAIPLALALRGDDAPTIETDPNSSEPAVGATGIAPDSPVVGEGTAAGASAAAVGADVVDSASTVSAVDTAARGESDPVVADETTVAAPADAAEVSEAPVGESTDDAVDAAVESVETGTDPSTSGSDAAIQEAATVDETAEREVPDCSRTYTAGDGDSWYRIADEAGVTPAELLRQNRATLDTVILPAAEICLPAGAAMPSPPTTTAAPTTTEAPTDTDAPATTAAPTTEAPTTTTAPLPPAVSADEVQAIIRETWPEDQHDKALAIARRESNYEPYADNGWCCVGVFQIYWTVHQGWLDDFGIHTRNDLKDARKNIAAAYELYQRSGGWGPWGG